MKTEIHNKKKHLLISLGIICLFGVIYAQDSKPKPKVTPQPAVTKKPPATKTTTTKATSATTNNKYGTVTDIDGNVYKTVKIGNQIWMAENLKTTRYNDGTPIPNVMDNEKWKKLKEGACCYYNNAYSKSLTYGMLYNWYAVNTGKLAPKGWHIPSDAEIQAFLSFLGGEIIAGERLKSTSGWENNGNGKNSFGFNGLPAGIRTIDGTFQVVGYYSYFWSSTEDYSKDGYGLGHNLRYENSGSYRISTSKSSGFSVRCIKD